MQLHVIAFPGILALVCAWSLAVAVLLTGPGLLRDRLLALLLFVEGTAWATGSGFLYLVQNPAVAWHLQTVFVFAMIAMPACVLAFAGTLPSPLMAPLRVRGVLPLLSVVTLAAELLFVTHPQKFVGAAVPAWYATWDVALPPLAIDVFNLTGLAGVVSLVGAVSAWAYSPRGSWARQQAWFFAVAFAIHDLALFLALVLPGRLIPPPPSGHISDIFVILGVNLGSIAFALLLAYGMLKVQLFDIDLRIKRGIRRSTVAAVFVAVFLIVEQLVQNYLNNRFGILLGAVAAGLALFAFGRIHRFADRVADSAMPHVEPTSEYLTYRKFEVYRAAAEGLYADLAVSEKERATLERLRAKLGIQPGDASAIEDEVRRATTERRSGRAGDGGH
jgi:hypothetical protein